MKNQLHSYVAMVRIARALTRFLPTPAIRWVALLALVALAFWPQPTQAAVTEAWVHRYSNVVSNANDLASKVVTDAAGDIIVTGTTYSITGDMLTIKYSGADGSVLWQQRYNGPENGWDEARALAVDSRGNAVVTGSSQNDFYTAKYAAADGALLWEKRGPEGDANALAVDSSGNVAVTGSSYNNSSGNVDYYTAKYAAEDGALLWEKRGPEGGANALAVDASDNVVVTGSSQDDFYTAKFAAADGAMVWEKRYDGPGPGDPDSASAVAVDGSGNVVVTGTSSNRDGSSGYYTAKYAAGDGALLWENRYNGPANYDYQARALALDATGNVVVTGTSEGDIYTAKFAASDGTLLWQERYNGPANSYDAAYAVAVDSSGNVVVTGFSIGDDGNRDFYTAKYAAADGALLWEKRYKGRGIDPSSLWIGFGTYSVAVDSSGNVLIAGASGKADGSGNSDYYTAKYAAADGALLWEKSYNGPANREDFAKAVAVDSNGNVVVTGYSSNGTNNDTAYTAKYRAVDGVLLWEKRHNGPASSYDSDSALALDASGNVVVTGTSYNDQRHDYYTAKYATANGELLWEKHYNGPADGDDFAKAVAVDASGNVVVTGASGGDYYTAKYAPADGALLWEKRYNGPASNVDQAEAVAVDASGNAVVTGGSTTSGSPGGGFAYDYYTAKYAAADGALLWEKRGPKGYAKALALDASGNVVVTGYFSDADYYTAKYAAADGALLWEKRYNGPANSYDFANAVAVDGSGNVVVTGSSVAAIVGNRYISDYYTAKYAAADGALLWENRSNRSTNAAVGLAVAVDASGDIVVTGSFNNGGYYDNDYYTAKYAAADGALLWEKRYNGPANWDDYPSSLALGPNGMVVVTGSSAGYGAGYDFATVVYREALPPLSIERVSIGVRLRFAGTPSRSHNVERALTVIGPWSTINTQTAPASGLLEHIDANAPTSTAFYRTREP